MTVKEGMEMETSTGQAWKGRRIFLWAAWASPLVAVVIGVVFCLFSVNHVGKKGEREPAVLLFYLILLAASAMGGLAGILSLFGIRSWRNALYIIPGALPGICINGIDAILCFYAHALEGRNLGG